MSRKNDRRERSEVNAGSMADIAFLLLIFFLVTTTIMEDQGIRVRLPQWEANPPRTPVNQDNVLSVKVNAENAILLEREEVELKSIREQTKQFIMNPEKRKDRPGSPKNAIVSLQNDRGTSYSRYLEVYNEIKAAYNELWDDAALKRFGRSYTELDDIERVDVRKDIPLVISEAEPTDVQSLQ